ncbi:hypothetical protein evm_004711 [Chilo suppressalis]|nr:hypothetical protein evm_004711 [Chilo suppressalis]
MPGCQCVTRGPLSKFKLIGNIHFPRIKVTPPRHVTPPTDPGADTTICPPCPTCPPLEKMRFRPPRFGRRKFEWSRGSRRRGDFSRGEMPSAWNTFRGTRQFSAWGPLRISSFPNPVTLLRSSVTNSKRTQKKGWQSEDGWCGRLHFCISYLCI